MRYVDPANHEEGVAPGRAALIAGLGYLLMPAAFAEFYLLPKLIIPGNIEQTVLNIAGNPGHFVGAILCHLVTFILDVVIAWALYVLLAPVNRALSLLAAWFRLMYTAIGLFGLLNLVTVFRVLNAADYLAAFGNGPLHAQVKLLLGSFRYDWSMGLVIFGIHLCLVGCLVYRSRYIPRLIGILLAINGLGWVIDSLKPYLYPNAHLGFVFITFFGELIFMVWLLGWGRKLQERAMPGAVTTTAKP